MSESTVISTPEGISFHRLASMKHMLSIEIKTGMRNSHGSVMQVINREFGQSFRRKADALAYVTKLVNDEKVRQHFLAAVDVSLETGQPGICPVGPNDFDDSQWVAVDGTGWVSQVVKDDIAAWYLLREHIESESNGTATIAEGRDN